jgi:radical S-adenosyl methionine domain-containing protein 2
MKNQILQIIPSVNFHVWEPCNFRCKFCFATFQDVKNSILPKGHLPKEQALRIVEEISNSGFQKITFAGGEPTLCPWLPDLIGSAKRRGLKTMVVTNGWELIKNDYRLLFKLLPVLDWIVLSIDSAIPATNIVIGRALVGKQEISKDDYLALSRRIKSMGFRFKINTVVNSANWQEDLSFFILGCAPERWKILQALSVAGQNDRHSAEMSVTKQQFDHFLKVHGALQEQGVTVVPETEEAITGSYLMIDPAGRFFDDTKGKHTYSRPILEVGIKEAMSDISIDEAKFHGRGGYYDY